MSLNVVGRAPSLVRVIRLQTVSPRHTLPKSKEVLSVLTMHFLVRHLRGMEKWPVWETISTQPMISSFNCILIDNICTCRANIDPMMCILQLEGEFGANFLQ